MYARSARNYTDLLIFAVRLWEKNFFQSLSSKWLHFPSLTYLAGNSTTNHKSQPLNASMYVLYLTNHVGSFDKKWSVAIKSNLRCAIKAIYHFSAQSPKIPSCSCHFIIIQTHIIHSLTCEWADCHVMCVNVLVLCSI